jgi:hypothetical protein
LNNLTPEQHRKVRNKKGKQLREADKGYIVKDNIEYAVGKNVPIWMFGFIY